VAGWLFMDPAYPSPDRGAGSAMPSPERPPRLFPDPDMARLLPLFLPALLLPALLLPALLLVPAAQAAPGLRGHQAAPAAPATSAAPAAPATPPVAHAQAALLLQGFDLVWERRPHRLRVLGVGALASSPDASAPAGILWAEVQGGTWASGAAASDQPTLSMHYAGLRSDQRPLLLGSTTLDISGNANGDPTGRVPAAAQAHVRVDGVDTDSAAVWLRGFRITTAADHPVGYTIHALTIDTGEPRVVAGGLEFDVSVLVEAAPVPDREQSLAAYGARVQVDWVAVPSSADRLQRVRVGRTQDNGLALAATAQGVSILNAPAQWEVQAPQVVAGLSGFQVHLQEEGRIDGRYCRALTMDLADDRYDPVLGRWMGLVGLRFANAGQVTRPVRADLEARVTALALRPGESAWSGRWQSGLDGPGEAQVSYPGAAP